MTKKYIGARAQFEMWFDNDHIMKFWETIAFAEEHKFSH